jgi:hypothetical protein
MDKDKDRKTQEEEADELESKMEDREDARIETERDEQEDLNQGMQTGTHDASHPGIKWGASYKVKKAAASPSRGANDTPKDSDKKG